MPTPPQDLYEDVLPTPAAPPPTPRPSLPARPAPTQPLPSAQYTSHRRLPILIAIGVVLLGGLGAGAYLFFRNRTVEPTVNTAAQNAQTNTTTNTQTTVVKPAPVAMPPDADADGLEDSREQELGTNKNAPDTDGDGLSDREEVLVYTTDPKKPDTDGDGNTDGAEVKKGYNPKGSGLLLDLQAAKEALQ